MSWLNKSFSRSVSSGHYDVAALKGDVVDKVSAAIMMIDRDFVVTYVNGPTRELLRKNAAAFAAMWPGLRSGTDRRQMHRHVSQEPGAPAPDAVRPVPAANPD